MALADILEGGLSNPAKVKRVVDRFWRLFCCDRLLLGGLRVACCMRIDVPKV